MSILSLIIIIFFSDFKQFRPEYCLNIEYWNIIWTEQNEAIRVNTYRYWLSVLKMKTRDTIIDNVIGKLFLKNSECDLHLYVFIFYFYIHSSHVIYKNIYMWRMRVTSHIFKKISYPNENNPIYLSSMSKAKKNSTRVLCPFGYF